MVNQNLMRSGRFGTAIRMPAPSIADANPLYATGDTVMHPSEGICTIHELRLMEFGGTEKRLYYILKPTTAKSSSTVYLPIARGNSILRRLLTRESIYSLIARSSEYAGLWIADSKQRKDAFSKILSEGNYAKIIRMLQEIYEENAARQAEGKKPCSSDDAIRAEAERLLHQEFSYVLNLSLEDTAAFIVNELNKANKSHTDSKSDR